MLGKSCFLPSHSARLQFAHSLQAGRGVWAPQGSLLHLSHWQHIRLQVPMKVVQLSLYMSFLEDFLVKSPPMPLGGEIHFPARDQRWETAQSCYHGNHVSPGPQGALLEMVWNLITVFELENHG